MLDFLNIFYGGIFNIELKNFIFIFIKLGRDVVYNLFYGIKGKIILFY